jgi:predicted DNA-binding helix-hairpin-helix protein
VQVARTLREVHGFRGYIHLKTIPDADPDLLAAAGRYADRLSINVELPTEQGLAALAPEKNAGGIRRSMARMRLHIDAARAEKRERFAPAGQSTQMIVGADGATDRRILGLSSQLYGSYGLRRVYYSAFSPIPHASAALPLAPAPLLREHRLYQADWLMRFYGFEVQELATGATGMLALEHDPKLAWALAHRAWFPVDINAAPREMLLRVPGLGVKTVRKLLSARRHRRLRLDDLARLRLPLAKIAPFIIAQGHHPAGSLDRAVMTLPPPVQADLFA